MNFEEWFTTHWRWGSSTDEAKARRAWESAQSSGPFIAYRQPVDVILDLQRIIQEKEAVIELMNETSGVLLAEKDAEIERLKGSHCEISQGSS